MLVSRRKLVGLVSLAVAQKILSAGASRSASVSKRLVLITTGGIRRQESFSQEGVANIPHLVNDLFPQSLFYPFTVNEGVTSHFNTISSMLTGVWQHVDDWGSQQPANPTLFHYLQRQLHADCRPDLGGDQQQAAHRQHQSRSERDSLEAADGRGGGAHHQGPDLAPRLEREQILQEMTAVLETDYERVGFGVPSASAFQNPEVKQTFVAALANFIHGPNAPTSGDELTFMIAREVLQRLAPAMLMLNFSDMEVAHSGSYSLHLAGIRRADELCHRMWQFIQSNPELSATTSLVIMDEFGRDPDGSGTNGFFNHRTDTECCRMTWSMVLGASVKKPQLVERVVRQVDMAPSIANWMGFECEKSMGSVLPEFHG